jgi:hypothetical protein
VQPADSIRLSSRPPRAPQSPGGWKGLEEAASCGLVGLAELAAGMRPSSLPARMHRSEREMVHSAREDRPASRIKSCMRCSPHFASRGVSIARHPPACTRSRIITSYGYAPHWDAGSRIHGCWIGASRLPTWVSRECRTSKLSSFAARRRRSTSRNSASFCRTPPTTAVTETSKSCPAEVSAPPRSGALFAFCLSQCTPPSLQSARATFSPKHYALFAQDSTGNNFVRAGAEGPFDRKEPRG